MTDEENRCAVGASRLSVGLERTPMSLVEYAKVCMGGNVSDVQRTLLEALERGEKLPICQTTGRPLFDDIYRNWRAHVDLMRSNVK